jgi:hypothetical protein
LRLCRIGEKRVVPVWVAFASTLRFDGHWGRERGDFHGFSFASFMAFRNTSLTTSETNSRHGLPWLSFSINRTGDSSKRLNTDASNFSFFPVPHQRRARHYSRHRPVCREPVHKLPAHRSIACKVPLRSVTSAVVTAVA